MIKTSARYARRALLQSTHFLRIAAFSSCMGPDAEVGFAGLSLCGVGVFLVEPTTVMMKFGEPNLVRMLDLASVESSRSVWVSV